jgi:hypothetical protein
MSVPDSVSAWAKSCRRRTLFDKFVGGRIAMRHANRLGVFAAVIFSMGLVVSAAAQLDKKPFHEWSEKDATKVLNDSGWGQTQTYTDTSNQPNTNRAASNQTLITDVVYVNFRIRFLSAKPVRQAFCRMIELQQKGGVNDQLAKQLDALANADFPDYVVISVLCDSPSQSNKLQQANAGFFKYITAELKNDTYLLTKGGQRVFLHEYQAPRKDGLGAKFIFPRLVDGKPVITPESQEVLFHSELPGLIALNMRYKVKDMMFNGKLEY